MKKPVALIILDGFGKDEASISNAILAAKTPTIDRLYATCPSTTLEASGLSVGLPEGQMGNSEVGHTSIGAGRVIYQELTKISKHIKDGTFQKNPALLECLNKAKASALHILGLLSDGGVHSHIEHLYGILKFARDMGVNNVYVHCFMDGRDVSPTSGIGYVRELQAEMEKIGIGKIATVSGRYYAMDRDNRWERVERAFLAVREGIGENYADAVSLLEKCYAEKVTDEFIPPSVIGQPVTIQDGDSVLFFNFRPDRARELTRSITDPSFAHFSRPRGYISTNFVCMTQYDASMPNVSVAFPPETISNTFGEYLAKQGLNQLRIAETEKYAHVTFFFNAGIEQPYENEDRILVASPKVATYDMQPEMSAYEVTDKAVDAVKSGKYDCIILNYANCDMVGHTGVFDAAVKAVEAVDTCLGRVLEAIDSMGGIALVTADHGNVDKMCEEDGSPMTAHTTAPVPFIVHGGKGIKLRNGGILADIAPTMLHLLELPQPIEMTGKSIII